MATGRRPSKTLSRWSKLRAIDHAKQSAAVQEQPAVSQRTLDRITKERDELNKKLISALADNDKLKTTLHNVKKKVMDTANPTPFLTGAEKDPSELSEQELISMIGALIPVEKNVPLESKIEELETRITLLSGELGKLFKLKLKTENSLRELGSCQDLETMQQAVKKLWLQSSTTKLFARESMKLEDLEESDQGRDSPSLKQNGIPASVQINLEPIQIAPATPVKKAPDTHIKSMQLELREMVIQELSLYKSNGADWRMFAQRVGVSDSLLATWQQMKIAQPMRNVLCVWAASPGATVRMLHRHLISPQMRCLLLARRISDYYQVD